MHWGSLTCKLNLFISCQVVVPNSSLVPNSWRSRFSSGRARGPVCAKQDMNPVQRKVVASGEEMTRSTSGALRGLNASVRNKGQKRNTRYIRSNGKLLLALGQALIPLLPVSGHFWLAEKQSCEARGKQAAQRHAYALAMDRYVEDGRAKSTFQLGESRRNLWDPRRSLQTKTTIHKSCEQNSLGMDPGDSLRPRGIYFTNSTGLRLER